MTLLQGRHEATYRNAQTDAERLVAAGRLLMSCGLDPVDHTLPPLDYEPRVCIQSESRACFWVGTKAGELVRIDLDARGGHGRGRLDSGIRALAHLGGGRLLVGTDDGRLWLVDGTGAQLQCKYWWLPGGDEHGTPPGTPATAFDSRPADIRHTVGVTAIHAIRDRSTQRDVALVATRDARLRLVCCDGAVGRLTNLHTWTVAGWVQWICPQGDRGSFDVVTRQGDWYRIDVVEHGDPTLRHIESLGVIPTSVASGLHGSIPDGTSEWVLFVGTRHGLAVVRRGSFRSLPVTRSGVGHVAICPDTRQLVLGLSDARFRIIDERHVSNVIEGRDPTRPSAAFTDSTPVGLTHRRVAGNRAVPVSASVLIMSIVTPKRATTDSARFLLVATSDHCIHVFRSVSPSAVETWIRRIWHHDRDSGLDDGRHDIQRLHKLLDDQTGSDAAACAHALAEHVLPSAPAEAQSLLESTIQKSDVDALESISRSLWVLSGRPNEPDPRVKADELLATSVKLLEAVERKGYTRWIQFVTNHLRDLQHAIRSFAATYESSSDATHQDLARLIAWHRFVRKYLLLGKSFASKQINCRTLANRNHRVRKFLDALIYEARMYQSRTDMLRLHPARSPVCATGRVASPEGSGTWYLMAFADGRVEAHSVDARESSSVHISISEERDQAHALAGYVDGSTLVVLVCTGRPLLAKIYRVPTDRPRVQSHASSRVAGLGDDIEVGCASAWSDRSGRDHGFFLGLRDLPGHPMHHVIRNVPGRGWTAEPPIAPPHLRGSLHQSKPSGNVVTSAIATTRDSPWAAVGRSDGTVFLFNRESRILVPISRLPNPISALELGRIGDQTYCFIGTTYGDLHATCIEEGHRDVWRETFDDPVVGLQIWHSPAYVFPGEPQRHRPILAAATRNGRLTLLETSRWPKLTTWRSESGNFAFRGMRLDRISVSEPLAGLCLADGSQACLAVTTSGAVEEFDLLYTRDATDRDRPAASNFEMKGMFQRLDDLYEQVVFQRVLRHAPDAAQSRVDKLEILRLIKHEDGALDRYLLRRELFGGRKSFTAGDEVVPTNQLPGRIQGQMSTIDPSRKRDRESLKIIIKVVGRRLLGSTESTDAEEGVRLLLRCDEIGATATDLIAARIRISVAKQLFRPSLLQRVADNPSLLFEASGFLVKCLRDSQRLVRVEALRAISVCLRNIGIEVDQSSDPTATKRSYFPEGPTSIRWIVDALCEDLRRYPSMTQEEVKLRAWYHMSALMPVFRLFPNHTFTLCETVARKCGSSTLLVDMADRFHQEETRQLRDKIAFHTGARTTRTISSPDRVSRPDLARGEFLSTYWRKDLRTTVEEWIDPRQAGDSKDLVLFMCTLFECLAELWSVKFPEDLADAAQRCRTADLLTRFETHPLDTQLKTPVALLRQMLDVAERLPKEPEGGNLDDLVKYRGTIQKGEEHLTDLEKHVFLSILDHWQTLYDQEEPRQYWNYRDNHWLGARLGRGRLGAVYESVTDKEGATSYVVKLCLNSDDGSRERFRHGARVNEQLSQRHSAIVRVTSLDGIQKAHETRPYYEMENCDAGSLEKFLRRHDAIDRKLVVVAMARDLGSALAHAHGREPKLAHGDIHARNILVSYPAKDHHRPRFKLSDFDFAVDEGESSNATFVRAGSVPETLRRGARGSDRQWQDVASLAMLLGLTLTRKPFPLVPTPRDVQALRGKLLELARDPGAGVHHELGRELAETLADVLDPEKETPMNGVEFLRRLGRSGRPCAFISYHHSKLSSAFVEEWCAETKDLVTSFYDKANQFGAGWRKQVKDMIWQAEILVAVASDGFAISNVNIADEIQQFQHKEEADRQVKILPIQIDDSTAWHEFGVLQHKHAIIKAFRVGDSRELWRTIVGKLDPIVQSLWVPAGTQA